MAKKAVSPGLRDVLAGQRTELERRLAGRYVERHMATPVRDNDLIKVVIGPRRAGKSYFATRLVSSFGPYGYANLDDERLVGLTDYDQLIAAIDQTQGKPTYLLLDEVQNLDRWELLVNRLQRQGRRLIVTGSNAHLLGRELATHLTGRHQPITLLPFSFAEYLAARSIETESETKQALLTYAEHGGLPETVMANIDPHPYASTLLDAILYKDIVRRARIRVMDGLGELTRYLATNVASEYSLRGLTGLAGCASEKTVQKYLGLLEEAFLFFSLKRFSFKVREQAKANRKIYCIDNGFVTAKGFLTGTHIGRLCENLVAIALKQRELAGDSQVFFWKDPQQHEVDFVVRRGRSVEQLIQVSWDLTSPKTKEREVRALLKASRELSCENLLILTGDTEGEERVSWFGMEGTIRMMPIEQWLRGDGVTR
jgi:predicted AAA+ superfamily ATPase